jgi:hypothetical protein
VRRSPCALVSTPAAVWDRTVWTPAEIRGGKFLVHLKLNGAEYKDLFLDTGSSAFPLIVDTGPAGGFATGKNS